MTSDIRGGYASIDYSHSFDRWTARLTGGASPEWLRQQTDTGPTPGFGRYLGLAEARVQIRQIGDMFSLAEWLTAHGTIGRTDDETFDREIFSAALHVGLRPVIPIDLSAMYGRVSENAPLFEQFSIGGLASTLTSPALLSQRIMMPALPATVATGEQILTYRAATSLGQRRLQSRLHGRLQKHSLHGTMPPSGEAIGRLGS